MNWSMKVLDLIEQSVVFQGILAVSVVGAVVYLSVCGQPVPDQLSSLAMIIVGFFFGSKSTTSAARAAREAVENMRSNGG